MAILLDIDLVLSQLSEQPLLGIVGRRGPNSFPYAPRVFVVREPEGLEIIEPEEESWDELSRLLVERPADVLEATHVSDTGVRGLWAITSEYRAEAIVLREFGRAPFSEAERKEARALAAAALGAPRWSGADLSRSDYSESRVRWRGYVHNAIAAALAGALIWSLAWLRQIPRRRRKRRRARALSRGRCPGCGYSIAGLERGRCPECGAEWSGAEVAAARDAARRGWAG